MGSSVGRLIISQSLTINSHQGTQQNRQIHHHTCWEKCKPIFESLRISTQHDLICTATYSTALPSTMISSIHPIIILHSSHQPHHHICTTHGSPYLVHSCRLPWPDEGTIVSDPGRHQCDHHANVWEAHEIWRCSALSGYWRVHEPSSGFLGRYRSVTF